MISSHPSREAIRGRWPRGPFGWLAYITDHVILRFDRPVDWLQQAADEISCDAVPKWPIPGAEASAGSDAIDTSSHERPASSTRINRCRAWLSSALVVGMFWLAGLAAAASLLHLGRKSLLQARAGLEEQARNYAHLIAAHDRYGFSLAEALLQSASDQLRWSDFNTPLTPTRHAEVVELLRRHADRLPGIASFSIIGADGIRRAGIINKDGTDLRHREYFQALRNGRSFFISNAEEGLASGKTGIHVARRFNGLGGAFGGVVVINLAVQDVFYPFYKSLQLGASAVTTLQDVNRTLLAFPAESEHGSQFSSALSETGSSIIASGAERDLQTLLDTSGGTERIAAFERLEGSGIVATVSLSTAKALEAARLVLWISVFGAIASLFTTLGATAMFLRSRFFAKARDQALLADGEKRRLIQSIDHAIEDERRSIALEIHDALNAAVVGARLEAHHICTLADETPCVESAHQIKSHAVTIAELLQPLYERGRRLIGRLRPEALDTIGLRGAIEGMVQHHDAMHPECHFSFRCSGDVDTLDDRCAMACYRIIQEALSNVAKHALASNVSVSINADRTSLNLQISDDGRGFEGSVGRRGLGLVGISERAAALGGTVEFATSPGEGTRVSVSIPLRSLV